MSNLYYVNQVIDRIITVKREDDGTMEVVGIEDDIHGDWDSDQVSTDNPFAHEPDQGEWVDVDDPTLAEELWSFAWSHRWDHADPSDL